MGVNKTLTLSWEGKEYPLIITMRIIDYIESRDINLLQMFNQFGGGDVRFSHVAKLISILLNSAGAEVSQEKVWEGMFGDGDLQAADCILLLREIFAAIFPDTKKKSTVVKKPRKTSKRTRGKTSTK